MPTSCRCCCRPSGSISTGARRRRSTRRRAEEPAQVAADQDGTTLEKIRLHLLRRIARWQIFIEVTPTSNLIIAGLSHPVDQPMFQLRPVDARAAECVPIVLSSDNPITLATTLADEYAYAWAGIVVGGGRPPTYAREWLDEVAANSMRARFTVSSRPTPIT